MVDPQSDGDPLALREDNGSFTVSVASPPSSGEGVYWCGVQANSSGLIKLAESYFYGCKSSLKYIRRCSISAAIVYCRQTALLL